MEKRDLSIKKAVDEKQAIKKRVSNARILARSKEPIITKEPSDSQSPSPANKNADNTQLILATSNLESLSAFTSVIRRDNLVSKEPILTSASTNKGDEVVSEDTNQKSATGADSINLTSDDGESFAGGEQSHKPKLGTN